MEEDSLFGGSDDGTFVPFTDILFNALLGFAFMVFIAFSLINPDAKSGDVNVKAEMIVTVSWPDNTEDDVDTYVEDPGRQHRLVPLQAGGPDPSRPRRPRHLPGHDRR